MFWLRNKKNYFQLRTLIRGPVPGEEFIPDIFFTSCMENNVDPDLYLQYFRKRIFTGSTNAGYKHQFINFLTATGNLCHLIIVKPWSTMIKT